MKMLLGGLIALTLGACGTSTAPSTATISLGEFNRITTGMPCDQLAGIIGGPGRVMADGGQGDLRTIVYGWDGEGGTGANASVTCQGGKVALKAQAGLR